MPLESRKKKFKSEVGIQQNFYFEFLLKYGITNELKIAAGAAGMVVTNRSLLIKPSCLKNFPFKCRESYSSTHQCVDDDDDL